jgi:hypothetical protein
LHTVRRLAIRRSSKVLINNKVLICGTLAPVKIV